MTVVAYLRVNRSPQVEALDDRVGTEIELRSHEIAQILIRVSSARAERRDGHGDRMRDTDDVCKLNLALRTKTRGD